MGTSLTIKNIPEAVYTQLREAAARNRRSLNSEAIVCLETVLLPERRTVDQELAEARALRASLGTRVFSLGSIDSMKRSGRP